MKGLVFALAVLAAATLPGSAFAANEAFTVRSVPVDATAPGSAEAREVAIAEGQVVAFGRLVHRLTRKQDWGFAAQVAPDQIANLVLGIEVAEERTSATHYVGKITYSFKAGAVRDLLNRAGIGFSETRARPALLLAVLDAANGVHLWDDPNPWRTAWARRDLADELVPVFVPLNDLEDSTFISAARAADATWPDVSPIAEKYGLDRVLIARATARGGNVDIRLAQLSATGSQATSFNLSGGGDLASQLDQAVDSALDRLYEDWKTATITVYGQSSTLEAAIWFSNLADWLTIQRRLREAPTITHVVIVGLSPQGAEVRLSYGGSTDQLTNTLAQVALVLSQRNGGWEIAMAERAAMPAPSALVPTNGGPVRPPVTANPPANGNTN